MNGSPVILHIDTGTGFRGGQRQLLLLAGALRQAGIPQLVALPPRSPLISKLSGIPTIRLSSQSVMRKIAIGPLWESIETYGVNIIHAHNSEAHTLGISLKKAFPHLKLIVSRRVIFPPSSKMSIRFKYRKHVDCYIAVSHAVADELRRIGVDEDKITVVHSALDLKAISESEKDETVLREISAKYGRIIVTAGALTREKDFETAIKAIIKLTKDVPDACLIILGDGPKKDLLNSFIRDGEIENIFLLGYQESITPILKNCHLFLLTSRSEGLNTSTLEAMACGLPAIVSNVGGLPEIVEPGFNGFLCLPGDADSFAKAMKQILTDDTVRERMARNALEKAKQFDIAQLSQKTVEIYNRVLA